MCPTPGDTDSWNTVSNNRVIDNHAGGIVLHTHTPGSTVTGNAIVPNVIVGNGPDNGVVTTTSVGISVGASASPITQLTIANNIIANENIGIALQDNQGLQNSILYGNWMNKQTVTKEVSRLPIGQPSAKPAS